MPEIVVKYDDKVVQKVVTEKKHVSIGRTSDNDIVLDNRGVSRKHAQIEFEQDGAIVIDNDSLNGTFVNNRKVTEERLRDNDKITIGKYDLIFHSGQGLEKRMSEMDGTMVLHTRAHRERLQEDKQAREMTARYGGSVLVSVSGRQEEQHPLDREVTTIGKSKFCTVRIKGWFVPQLAAKIVQEGLSYTLINLGRPGITLVNGEAVTRYDLKNGDLVQIGKSVFKFLEAGT